MSNRQMRKLLGDAVLPPPAESDEEFEPLYTKSQSSRFHISDEDELNDNVQPQSEKSDSENGEGEAPAPRKKKNKKKKKKKNRGKDVEDNNTVEPGTSSQDNEELDEIDRSVREVNQLLGEVEIKPSTSTLSDEKTKPQDTFMTINPKYLNSAFEMRKMLGTETASESRGKRDGHPSIMLLQRRAIIVPMEEYVDIFKKAGLSMSVVRREGGCSYFAFSHDSAFRTSHRALLRLVLHRRVLARDLAAVLKAQVDQERIDPELWLQFADELFMAEENTHARHFVERAVAYFQYVAHPAFNLADSTVRLEYRYLENQAFFTGCLRVIYLRTNRACHRSALELGKLLLQLDPEDPLALLLIMDALALRAREHRWLLAAAPQWARARAADQLYNLLYSVALAKWHVATKDKEDIAPATAWLRSAILRFPRVLLQLAQLAALPLPPDVARGRLFTHYADRTSTALVELGLFYARLTYNRFREPKVASWLIATASELARDLEWDGTLQSRAESLTKERLALYRAIPVELMRHMVVIRPMGSLLHDNLVHSVSNVPEELPPAAREVDRYEYKKPEDKTNTTTNTLYEFLRSLVPGAPPGPLEPDAPAAPAPAPPAPPAPRAPPPGPGGGR